MKIMTHLTKLFIVSLFFCNIYAQHFNVEIDETGESTLFIFEDTIESLEAGDEVGLFDSNGIIDDAGNTGEILVGAGEWDGSQLSVTTITSVDLSQFGGPILPGAVQGNTMSLKIWKVSEELEYNAAYDVSIGSGNFDGLFTAINEVYLAESHFNVEIDETGESTLFIFEDTIENLEAGDEVGLFDSNGIIDVEGNTGEILVGAGEWDGTQLTVTAITAVDLSQFNGPILPGAVQGNTMSLKVWDNDEEVEYEVTYSITSGSGAFDGLFTAINGIALSPTYTIVINEFFFRANEDVPDYVELFNYGTEDIDLTGWDLLVDDDGELGSFDGVSMAAGEYLLLAGDDPFFNVDGDELYAGEDIDNSLFFDINLGTSNDPIQLLDASGNEVDLVTYSIGGGWPVGNDYRGHSVELSDPYSDNNDASNWDSSEAEGMYMYTEGGQAGEDFGTAGEVNSNYNENDCQSGVYDCAGVCDGDAVEDCAGECGGDAEVDDCGVCDGGNADDLGCGCFEAGPSGCDETCGSTLGL